MKMRSTTLLAVVLFFGAYFVGYAIARHEHWIVHRAGFYTDSENKRRVADHSVGSGDFGTPALASKIATAQALVAWLYLPICRVETFAWRIMMPPDSEWPK